MTTDGSYRRHLDMNLIAEVSHVDTARLMTNRSNGAGIIDGRATLQARRANSLEHVSGTFGFKLSQVEALQIPVLSEVAQAIELPTISGMSKRDSQDGGVVRGRLSGQVIYVDEIAIQQSNVQVLVDGKSTIDGRLDLDLTASTGETSPTEGLVSMLHSPLMLAAPAPVALIAKANEAMKDRVVNVHVGGTIARPLVKVQPAKTLTQDAIRFFLSSSVGSSVAGAAMQSRNQKRR